MKSSLLVAFILVIPLLAHEGHDHHEAAKAPNKASSSEVSQGAAKDVSAWIKDGNAFMQKSRESADTTLFDKAEAAYERALTIDPENVDALVGMAWVHNSRHEFPEGMSWAKKAIAAGARDHMPHSLLGDAAMELGKYDEAFEHYEAAINLSPNLSTYSRAAHLFWLTGNSVKARIFMQKAIDAGGPYPENAAWCRAELALMLFNTGALLPAEQQIQLALKQTPENHHVLYVAGKIKVAEKKYDQAAVFLKKSIALNSGHGNHDAFVALGDLYGLLGSREEANEIYAQLVAMHTGHSHSHDGGAPHVHEHTGGNAQLARFYADHNRDLTNALQEAELAYETYPNVFVTTTLAWCYYKNERYQEAAKMIQKALRFGTQDAAIYFRAGMIAAKLKDDVTAQKHLAQALSLNPNFHPTEAKAAVETLQELAARARSR